MGKPGPSQDDGDGLDTPEPVIARLRRGCVFAMEMIGQTSPAFLSREEPAYTTPPDYQAPNTDETAEWSRETLQRVPV